MPNQNSTNSFGVFMGEAGLTLTVTLKKSGGSFFEVIPGIVDHGNGWYTITPLAAHRDTLGVNNWLFVSGDIVMPYAEEVATDSFVGVTAQLTGIAQNILVVMAQVDAVEDAVELVGTDVDDLSDNLDSYYSLLSAPLGKLEDTVQDDGSGNFQFTVASHALIGGGSGGDGETVYVITIPAIEADAIQAGIEGEITRYRGTKWTIAVEGLASQPTKCYCTVKRGDEPDAKSILQVTNTDGLGVLHGSANGIDSSQASIAFQAYDDNGTTKYRAIATFEGEATAEVTPNRYKIDFKEVDTPAELGVARLIVEKPVTDAVS